MSHANDSNINQLPYVWLVFGENVKGRDAVKLKCCQCLFASKAKMLNLVLLNSALAYEWYYM